MCIILDDGACNTKTPAKVEWIREEMWEQVPLMPLLFFLKSGTYCVKGCKYYTSTTFLCDDGSMAQLFACHSNSLSLSLRA